MAHQWFFFENGDEPVDGSCGSTILNPEGKVVRLFRFVVAESILCLSVSAMELREYLVMDMIVAKESRILVINELSLLPAA